MNYLRCTMCGGKLLPGEKEKTILICENCNNIVDLNQYLKVTVDIDNTSTNQKEKERLMKNVQLHINNNNFEYADKTLKELEFNYPGEQAITDLRDAYDKGLDAFIQKKKKLEQIRIRKQEIEELEQNIQTFILQNPTLFSSDSDEQQIDISDVSKACKLLSQANEYKIPAADLRSGMANLHNNVIKGNTSITDYSNTYFSSNKSNSTDKHYSNLLIALSVKQKAENEILDIKEKKEELTETMHTSYYRSFILGCIGLIAFLFIPLLKSFNVDSNKNIFVYLYMASVFFLILSLTILHNGEVAKSTCKENEKYDSEKIDSLNQLIEKFDETINDYYDDFLTSTVNYSFTEQLSK